MWVILFVLLLGVVAGLWFLVSLRDSVSNYANMSAADMVRTGAEQTVDLMNACEAKSVGTYTVSQLMGTSFPASLPAGAHWVCQVSQGGSDANGTVAVLYTDGPATQWASHGSMTSQTNGAVLQQQYAWQVASDMASLYAGNGNQGIIAGVVVAGDATPNLEPISGDQINLSGRMPGGLLYSSPVLVSGLLPPSI